MSVESVGCFRCLKVESSVFAYERLTRLLLVLFVSSSGIGMKTARATQFAKMVRRMIISNGLTDMFRKINQHQFVVYICVQNS